MRHIRRGQRAGQAWAQPSPAEVGWTCLENGCRPGHGVGDIISAEYLPDNLLAPERPTAATPSDAPGSLEDLERRHIQQVLADAATLEEAAARLGINPDDAVAQRKRYGIEWGQTSYGLYQADAPIRNRLEAGYELSGAGRETGSQATVYGAGIDGERPAVQARPALGRRLQRRTLAPTVSIMTFPRHLRESGRVARLSSALQAARSHAPRARRPPPNQLTRFACKLHEAARIAQNSSAWSLSRLSMSFKRTTSVYSVCSSGLRAPSACSCERALRPGEPGPC